MPRKRRRRALPAVKRLFQALIAIEQINSTIAFDCCSSYYKSELLEAKQQLAQLKKNDQAIIASMKAKDIDELVKDIARLGKDIQKNRANKMMLRS